jgi:hypothetical protein
MQAESNLDDTTCLNQTQEVFVFPNFLAKEAFFGENLPYVEGILQELEFTFKLNKSQMC